MKKLLLSAAVGSLMAAANLQAGVSTWNGTTSVAWTNAANWSPGIPADGDDVIIADTTGSGGVANLTDSRIIGGLTFGATGTRTSAFTISNSVAANSLTISNGLTANGALGAVVNFFKIPTIIAADQTWSIGGTPGAVTSDFGIGVVPRAGGTQVPFTLNANLTKTGSGQLTFIGGNITGNGNLTINQGVVKFNGGSSTTMSASGGGSIIINSGTKLMLFRNSGAVTCSKAITLNAGGTLEFGGNNTGGAIYGFPLTLGGNATFSSGGGTATQKFYILSGAWTGNAAINGTAVGSDVVILVLSNNITAWTGGFNNAGNGFRIALAAPAPGNPAVAWSLNQANAVLEAYGATNIQLGSLAGASGTLRNTDPTNRPVTVNIGALNTSTTFGGTIADNTAALTLVKVGTGTLNLSGNNSYSGGTIVSNGAVLLQGTGAAGSGPVTVRSGATFGGAGTASSSVSVDAGGTIEADGGTGAPALNVGSLTLGGGPNDVTTSSINVYQGGKVLNSSALVVNGTNIVNITGAAAAVGVYDLISYAGSIGGSGFAGFKLGTLPFGVVAHLQDSGSAVQLNITAVTIEPGIWSGNVLSQWDLAGRLEWKGATSGSPQPYHDLDVVTFDDSAASFNVNITSTVSPASLTVNNTAAYTFTGAGGVAGATALFKTGSGTLTVVNTNTYTGGTFITNGTLQIGNGGASGAISGPITDNGSIVANRSDAFSIAGAISGSGSVDQHGAGRTVLGGANTYLGLTTVSTGTLAPGTGTALGDASVGTVVSNGATLDINSQALGIEPISAEGAGVGGLGAIVNFGTGDSQNATRFVSLNGPTTFGGAFRWDIRDPAPANNPNGGVGASLSGNGNKLTKVSSNVVAMINVGDTLLGDIDIVGGTLTFSRSTFLGDFSKTITVFPGATLQLHRTSEFIVNALNKKVVITNGTLAVESNGLTNLFGGTVTLQGSNNITLPAATGVSLQNTVSGPGSVLVSGGGTLILGGLASYTGGTTVSAGTLQVDGSLTDATHPVVFSGPATLTGSGTVAGAVTIPAGGGLAPGSAGIGRLTINNSLVLSPGCSNLFEYSKDASSYDVVGGLTAVTLGGTLYMANVGSTTPVPGDNFRLFEASSYSGGFSAIVPATPGLGLIWVTNNLAVNGTISVAVLPNPIPLFALSASSLVSTSINVFFTAALDPNYATDVANYKLNTSNQVVSATVLNGTNVVLGLDVPLTNSSYVLNIKNVRDLSYVPNILPTTNIVGDSIGFLEAFSISITNGSAFAYDTNGQFKVYADGSDIFGTQDHGMFVYEYLTNNFDLAVRLESLAVTDPAAKAGLMARGINDPTYPIFDDRFFMSAAFTADATRNNNFVQYREDNGASALAPAAPRPPATYPNNWLRLKRVGSVFMAFSGPNGLDWTPMTFVDSSTNASGAYPDAIRVGVAVTSHNAALTTEAVFSGFGPAVDRGALTLTQSGNSLFISWGVGALGNKLQTTSDLTPPVVWTDVPGSTAVNSVSLPIGSGNAYFRLAR